MGTRPNIKIIPTSFDKMVGLTSIMLTVATIVFALWKYDSLPQSIATHFDAYGKVDKWGDKSSIWGLVIVLSIVSMVLLYIRPYARYFNHTVTITEDNAQFQYQNSYAMMTWMSFLISCIGLMLVSSIITFGRPMFWMLPLILVMIFGSIGYFVYRAMSYR
jgi:uncharacterized membrane protein